MTFWLAKSGLKAVHIRIQVFQGSTLVYSQEYDPSTAPTQAGQAPQPVNTQTTVAYETVTVTAGTFFNCPKVEVTSQGQVTDTWVNSNVPIFGLVKSETRQSGTLVSSIELIAYGG